MRRLPLLSLLAALLTLLLAPARLAADLVWTPQDGWKVEGGALAQFTGEEGRNALDLMNKARAAEENHSNGSALNMPVHSVCFSPSPTVLNCWSRKM